MLRPRLIVAILLVPVAVTVIALGGWLYVGAVLVILIGAGNEYVQLMRAGGRSPARLLVLVGICLFALIPLVEPALYSRLGPTAFVIAATLWHLLQYEHTQEAAAWDWAATIAGVMYIGGLGSYFLATRSLPDGQWWTLTVFPAIWMSDTGAYVIGAFAAGRLPGLGRHPMTPRLSPKKTWEGFVAGLISGVLFGALFASLWHIAAGPQSQVNTLNGAIVGLAVSLAGVVGDLGISMLKRQVGVKDTGDALAGHGGMLDRIDSWLTGGAVGYFCILLLILK